MCMYVKYIILWDPKLDAFENQKNWILREQTLLQNGGNYSTSIDKHDCFSLLAT
jgi:hypothetical protein